MRLFVKRVVQGYFLLSRLDCRGWPLRVWGPEVALVSDDRYHYRSSSTVVLIRHHLHRHHYYHHSRRRRPRLVVLGNLIMHYFRVEISHNSLSVGTILRSRTLAFV